MNPSPIEMSVVLYQDDDRCWVAQGLEHDITVVAPSLKELPDKFAMKVFAEVAISVELGLAPLEGIERAPQKFWQMYNKTDMAVNRELPPIKIEDYQMTPRFVPRMRVGELLEA
jgi:hypothetical protein